MGVPTIGAELLRKKFLSRADVARELGVSKQVVARWSSGLQRPAPEYRQALEEFLGIPADAWLDAEERQERKREFSEVIAEYLRQTQARAATFLASIAKKSL